ncbi:hypothetical protein D3C87_110280 [compost metagenome]
MTMTAFLLVSAIQGTAILLDEFFFHRKRGLPRWERIGHPFDTMTVIACLMFLYFFDRTPLTENIYIGMAVFSSICVTKDEWIHRKYCTAEEMWLHAILFMMHPLVLYTAMVEWETARPAFLMLSAGVFVFFVYQIVYWNFVEGKLRQTRQEAHYKKASQDDLYEYFGE